VQLIMQVLLVLTFFVINKLISFIEGSLDLENPHTFYR
jgi:hypothetical protein